MRRIATQTFTELPTGFKKWNCKFKVGFVMCPLGCPKLNFLEFPSLDVYAELGPPETFPETWRPELKQQAYYFSHVGGQDSCVYCTFLLLTLVTVAALQACTALHRVLLLPSVSLTAEPGNCAKLYDKEVSFPCRIPLHQGWRWWVTDMASCPSL